MNVDKFEIVYLKTSMSATLQKLDIGKLRSLAERPTGDIRWSQLLKKLWDGNIEKSFYELELEFLMMSLNESAGEISNFVSKTDEMFAIHNDYIKSMREFLEAEGISNQGVIFTKTQNMDGESPDWNVSTAGVKSVHQAIVWLFLFQMLLPKELEDKILIDFSRFRFI